MYYGSPEVACPSPSFKVKKDSIQKETDKLQKVANKQYAKLRLLRLKREIVFNKAEIKRLSKEPVVEGSSGLKRLNRKATAMHFRGEDTTDVGKKINKKHIDSNKRKIKNSGWGLSKLPNPKKVDRDKAWKSNVENQGRPERRDKIRPVMSKKDSQDALKKKIKGRLGK